MPSKQYHYIRKTIRHNGKRYEVRAKTPEEAAEKLEELKAQLAGAGLPAPRRTTVSDWYLRWRSLYKENSGITAKSLSSYDEKFRKYIQPYIGSTALSAVTDNDLQQILNHAAGMSYSQLTKIRSLLQQLFFRALKSRLISYNPADGLQLPACSRNQRRSLTDAERRVFLRVEPTVPGAILYYAMLMTGMRPGELVALQWSDVDFEKNEIHVSKALESGTTATIKSPKTAAGDRLIPMRRALASRLRPLCGQPDACVFSRENGTPHSFNTLHKLWVTLRGAMAEEMRAAGRELAGDLVPYCFRHTFCTDLQNAGIPINIAKELMGHSNISTTANVYTHRNEATLHSCMARLDAPKRTSVRLVRLNAAGGKKSNKNSGNSVVKLHFKHNFPGIQANFLHGKPEKGSGPGSGGRDDRVLLDQRQRRFHGSGRGQLYHGCRRSDRSGCHQRLR